MSQTDSELLHCGASLTVVGRTVSEVPYLMRWRDGGACPRPKLNSSLVVASLTVVGRTVSQVPLLDSPCKEVLLHVDGQLIGSGLNCGYTSMLCHLGELYQRLKLHQSMLYLKIIL